MPPEHPRLAHDGVFPRPELGHPNGVQLGGLGTGRIELGRTGRITLAGITNNWQRLLSGMRGTFFALRTGPRFCLLQEGGQAGSPGVAAVGYQGRHPVARVQYAQPDLEVRVALTAFSPLVPHDLARSSVPGAAFLFTVRNLGAAPQALELSFSWEHVLGCGGAGPKGRELVTERGGLEIAPWQGKAGGGLRFTSPLPPPGPARNRFGECLLAAQPPAGFRVFGYQMWNVLADETELLRALAEGRREPRFDAGWLEELLERQRHKDAEPPPSWDDPDPRYGGSRRGEEGRVHPAGVVGLSGTLAPDEQRVLPFVLAWHTPHHYALKKPETDFGHYYQNRFASAADVAEHLLSSYAEELRATEEVADLVRGADLPPYLADKLLNDSTPLTTNSIVARDGTLATLEASPMMDGALGTLDQRLISHPGYSLFYPELNRRELESFAALQRPSGALTHFSGNAHQALNDQAVTYGETNWPDLSCSFIIQCYRDWTETGEAGFCGRMWPHVERAMEYLIQADRDGDGVPEGGSSWDVEHYPGCFIVTATLWLATLRVLEQFALLLPRPELLPRLRERFALAEATVERMWAGQYYRKYYDPRGQKGSDDVFYGQLEGEWAARQLALEPVLPVEKARSAARTLYRLNGDPARYRLAPIQVQPDGRLTPRRYGWHAWPQYQMVFLDCAALYLGLEEQALDSVARFDLVVRELNRTPWATTIWFDARTGLPDFVFPGLDWYMNGPAIWFVLSALTGFQPNEVLQQIAAGPYLPPGRALARYPVVTPRYWADLVVAEENGRRCVTFTPRRFFRGQEIVLRRWRMRGTWRLHALTFHGRPVPCVAQASGAYTDLTWEAPLTLGRDDALSVVLEGMGQVRQSSEGARRKGWDGRDEG